MSYSQNKEDLKIAEYFKGRTGTLLSVGENDGITFSNAKLLIDNGWSAYLVEPSSVFEDMQNLHKSNKKVQCFKIGIGDGDYVSILHESGAHVKNGSDKALVSSVNEKETEKWRQSGVEFVDRPIHLKTFKTFYEEVCEPIFDFITIDAEGYDKIILEQIDLGAVGCKCLCIEWNGDKELERIYRNYVYKYGMKEILRNSENLVYAI